MITITRLISTLTAVFALATGSLAQEHAKETYLGNGAEFKGKTTEMKDKGQVAYVLSFKAGKAFEATTDGTKDTDVHLFVYDATGKELGTDESSGPKCAVRVTPELDGKCRFLITNAGGDNVVTFKVNIAD
jgi:hypothetical protein